MEIRVPGDKSLSHRAIMLSALAKGTSHIRGLLAGDDPRATARVFRALGVEVPSLPSDGSPVRIDGLGLRGLTSPGEVLDAQNSGTTARLLLGILAGQPGMVAELTGDESLRSRPMRRVTGPLSLMGARFEELGLQDRLPIRVIGGALNSLDYPSPVASAQVKSALLLAGLAGGVPVQITEPRHSRDHTERLLRSMGCSILSHPGEGGWRIEMRDPPRELSPLDFSVPGDFSSAAFPLALALLNGGPSELVIRDVGLNPTRTGLLRVLERMGASLHVEPSSEGYGGAGEPTGAIVVRPSALEAVEVQGDEVPAMVDEIPLLAVIAARVPGTTRISGASELRVKESDRLRALAVNLQAVGVEVVELEDGLEITGGDHPLAGSVEAFDDHRIAMSFGVLGALPGNRISVDRPEIADVSFPGYWTLISEIAEMHASDGAPSAGRKTTRPPVITLDGPAGSGKSSTARAVAARLGYRHLDSGAIYRALTLALLERGIDPEGWDALTEAELNEVPVRVEPRGERLEIYLGKRRLEEELRSARVTGLVSRLAQLPAVRSRLLDLQRQAGKGGGLVADGRDMGTVVFPDAELKFFLVADLDERARRRLLQEGVREPGHDEVEAEAVRIRDRDARDAQRALSPLKKPEGAVEIDTTRLSFDEQVDLIVQTVRELTRI
jgi:3-phosphoshikimate 1-carboxyvinyltransferase